MANQPITVLLPVSRMVQGNMYKAQDKDYEGRPRVYPPGHAKAGQPKISYFFAVAIAKQATDNGHWANTEWGKQIWAFGHGSWPNGQAQSPGFAWKIEDGDSAIPNKMGRKNVDREGFAGHWIVNLSSSFAPKIYTRDSNGRAQELIQPDAVKPGYWVQVQATIDSNETAGNPGIYINHQMVMLIGYGAEIRQGADPNAVQWASGPLPAGASAIPVSTGGMPATAPSSPPPPSAGGVTVGAPMAPVGGTPPPPGAAVGAPPPTPVQPSQSFIAPPAPGASPAPPAAPAAPAAPPVPPAGPQMTAKANGVTYAQFIANKWTDAQLREQGYMV